MKVWVTVNEPYTAALCGYDVGNHAPGIKGKGQLMYRVGHNMLKAHAEAYRVYDQEFRETQKGK